MKAQSQTEAIGQCQLVIDRIARVDRVVLLAHLPRQDVAAVRGDIEADIGWSLARAKADIVDEENEMAVDGSKQTK